MQVISSPAKTGKTTRLADLVRDDPNGILVVNFTRKEYVVKKCNLDITKVKTAEEVMRGALKGIHNCRLYVDDADHLLSSLFGNLPIKAIAIMERR